MEYCILSNLDMADTSGGELDESDIMMVEEFINKTKKNHRKFVMTGRLWSFSISLRPDVDLETTFFAENK